MAEKKVAEIRTKTGPLGGVKKDAAGQPIKEVIETAPKEQKPSDKSKEKKD
jgi:hypothetical protein